MKIKVIKRRKLMYIPERLDRTAVALYFQYLEMEFGIHGLIMEEVKPLERTTIVGTYIMSEWRNKKAKEYFACHTTGGVLRDIKRLIPIGSVGLTKTELGLQLITSVSRCYEILDINRVLHSPKKETSDDNASKEEFLDNVATAIKSTLENPFHLYGLPKDLKIGGTVVHRSTRLRYLIQKVLMNSDCQAIVVLVSTVGSDVELVKMGVFDPESKEFTYVVDNGVEDNKEEEEAKCD